MLPSLCLVCLKQMFRVSFILFVVLVKIKVCAKHRLDVLANSSKSVSQSSSMRVEQGSRKG